MEFLFQLLLISVWMGICVFCVFIGIFLKNPKQKEYIPERLSESEKRENERLKREFENFWTYNGEEQSR